MTRTAQRRGVTLTSKSRPLRPADLAQFDYIIGMESKNIRAVKVAESPQQYARVHMMQRTQGAVPG